MSRAFKCDICKRLIEDKVTSIIARTSEETGVTVHHELCYECDNSFLKWKDSPLTILVNKLKEKENS